MAMSALCGARIFNGEVFLDHYAVLVDGRAIADVLPLAAVPSGAARQTFAGGLLVPGFIDAQVNGGGGVLFNQSPDMAGIAAMALAHRRHGTSGLLPTFITDRPEGMAAALAAVREALAEGMPGILGVHLEGPFLAQARKGAHDPDLIRPLRDADVDMLIEAAAGSLGVLMLTLAAENASPRQIRRLADHGIIVSIGHSDATYEIACAAADAGASGITHLFNAMSQLGHRHPGVAGAALDHGGLWCGIIADGHHVDPAVLRLALRAKQGPARLFLVSDAMPPAGSPGDSFELTGRKVQRRDGKLTLEDGTLAGSDLTMDRAVRYAITHLRQPLAEALRMASLYPAQFLRLDHFRGRIAPGMAADMVLLDDDLMVRQVWIGGTPG